MKYQELIILLPCHSLEDFPVYSEGAEADSLLAGWTALWHPALIHSAGQMPSWSRMDDPPEHLEGLLLVVPQVSHTELPTGFVQRARDSGACAVRNKTARADIVAQALQSLDEGDGGVSPELAADFHALGYAYLQVQILTRQMRYSSNLDEVHFGNQVVAAAHAAAAGELEQAREKLTACFDLLAEERDVFYSVESYLLDFVMLTPETAGPRLLGELSQPAPVNLVLSAGVLQGMSDELREAVRQAWQSGRAGLVACDAGEAPLPLLGLEAVARRIRQGRDQVQRELGQAPTVFGRRRFGLTPNLPGVLRQLGYQAALHATLEEGRFPEGSQAKTRWEGSDGAALDCLARAPLDAARAEVFLGLALKTGESMDMDHVATLMLAHWPGAASPWLDDLRRIAHYTSALGKFVTVEQFFSETDSPGNLDGFSADRYVSPYLKQAIVRRQVDPLSSWSRHHRQRAEAEAVHTLSCLASFIDGRPRNDGEPLLLAIDDDCEQGSADRRAAELTSAAVAEVSAALPKREPAADHGCLVWNPFPAARRMRVLCGQWPAPPTVEKPVYAAEQSGDYVHAVVDVPPLGYIHLTPSAAPPAARRRAEPPLAEEGVLRNEFLEVRVNPRTGGLGSVHSYSTRGNRLSQQLALRLPQGPGRGARYSNMIADSQQVLTATTLLGEIETRGRLLGDDDQVVADFVQRLRVSRGSRLVEMDIELTPRSELLADPWNSYFASRFAWKEESAALWHDVNQVRHSAGDSKRLEATRYIEIEAAGHRTTVFPCGLPYHRRIGLAALDSLLQVRGESATEFRLAVGVDIPYPMQEAEALLAPGPWVHPSPQPPHASPSAWLFHIDARNVLATHWMTRRDGQRVTGFAVRLLECEGRTAQLKLRALRPLRGARRVDLDGQSLSECRIDDGAAHVELAPREWSQIEAWWDE